MLQEQVGAKMTALEQEISRRQQAERVLLTLTDDVIDLVSEGIDVAIRIGELADSSLITQKLISDRRIIYAAPAYLDH
jgi:DNA-binding transcriptional LysR family regulator